MGCRFPRRACAFSDYAIYGVAICTNDQPGAIQKKRVVAGWQIGELQARRIARRLLRRDQRQPTITDDPPFCDPVCAVAKLVGARITVVEDIGFVAGRVRAGTGIEGGFPPTRHASKISSESEALFIVVALKRDNSQAAQRGT